MSCLDVWKRKALNTTLVKGIQKKSGRSVCGPSMGRTGEQKESSAIKKIVHLNELPTLRVLHIRNVIVLYT